MKVEAIINKRKAEIELISKVQNHYKIKVNNKTFDFDIITIGNGSYSIIYNNNSWDLEAAKSSGFNTYTVYKFGQSFKVEIEDALSKYKKNKDLGLQADNNNIIAPMPGKIVKVLVTEGQKVKIGDTILIISAMKMESEYKVKQDSTVQDILVSEGDTIEGHQPLVIVE